MSSANKDPQVARVYKAETFLVTYKRQLRRAEIHRIIKQVSRLYGLKTKLRLKFYKCKNDWRAAFVEYQVIGDPKPMLVINSAYTFGLPDLLHELAHLVDLELSPRYEEQHGPRFCGIASWLYDRYNVVPSYAYEAVLERHGVKYQKAQRCSPARLARRAG